MAFTRYVRHDCSLPEEVEESTYLHCSSCNAVYVGARLRYFWIFETTEPQWVQVEYWPEDGYVKEDEHGFKH